MINFILTNVHCFINSLIVNFIIICVHQLLSDNVTGRSPNYRPHCFVRIDLYCRIIVFSYLFFRGSLVNLGRLIWIRGIVCGKKAYFQAAFSHLWFFFKLFDDKVCNSQYYNYRYYPPKTRPFISWLFISCCV